MLSYRQINSVRLQCEIDLKKLFPDPKERDRFDNNWEVFIESDPSNKQIFKLRGDWLKYQSEQLIPTKNDKRPPLLLVLGNPASHSIASGMFFAFKDNGKENRFWRTILKPAGVLNFFFDESLSANMLNNLRKQQIINFDYESPFRIGLCVFISVPSAPGGPWGGVAGVQKLIGAKALRRLEVEETKRIIESTKKFLSKNGTVVTFQKNAWNGLKSDDERPYNINDAKKGTLKGTLKDLPHIPLFGVPPTRLSGPCSKVLRKLLIK